MNSAALVQLRNMLSNLRQRDYEMPSRAEMIRALECIEVALSQKGRHRRTMPKIKSAAIALGTFSEPCSSGDLGRALDPDLSTEKACALGASRLKTMMQHGWAERLGYGAFQITDAGRRASAAPGEG